MSYFGYVGRLLSNVKGFYNEINSATLTGAIDVVIVQQEDGSFLCSPFHVRFGKLGVLRSREKVVDIEINGAPVDLHMKLGEAGEAFFVKEICEDGSEQIPSYLATSPIPSSEDLMEMGVRELHEQVALEEHGRISEDLGRILEEPHEEQPGPSSDGFNAHEHVLNDESQICDESKVIVAGKIKTHASDKEDENSVEQEKDSGKVIENSEQKSDTKVINVPQHEPKKDKTKTELFGESKHSISKTQSDSALTTKHGSNLSMSKRSGKKHSQTVAKDPLQDSDNSSKESGSREVAAVMAEKLLTEDNSKTKRRKKKKSTHKKSNPRAASKSEFDNKMTKSDNTEAIFDLEVTSDEDDSHQPPVLPSIVKSVSLPLAEEDRMDRTNIWANSQFEAHLHPFSDTDVTPVGSPSTTRCMSPTCKSDTECEKQRHEQADTDNMIPPSDTVWEWGQLPKPVPTSQADNLAGTSTKPATGQEQETNAKSSGGLFYFMRKTKAIRHKPEEEGIYLADLTKEEMDPEIAKLYFPKSSIDFMSIRDKEEDTESGRGASLPQSPHSVEGAIGGPPASYLMSEVRHLGEVSLSLCGGLADVDGNVSMESFMQSVVTFDTISEDLNLVQNPDLVVRIGDKFYNWATAAPQILSLVAFHRYLPEKAIQNLVKEHMPKKKEKKGGYSWFSWRRAPPDATQTASPDSVPKTITTTTTAATTTTVATVTSDNIATSMTDTVISTTVSASHMIPISVAEETVTKTSLSVSALESMTTKTETDMSVTSVESTDTTTTTATNTTAPSTSTALPSTVSGTVTVSTVSKTSTPDAKEESVQEEKYIEKLEVEVPMTGILESPCSSAPSSPKKSPNHHSINRLKDEESSENETDSSEKSRTEAHSVSSESTDLPPKKYKKSLRLSSNHIMKLNLHEGQNEITFSVTTQYQGTTRCTSHIYLWRYDDKIVISDIDGTITKSDVLGQILPILGRDWSQSGVAELYTKINNNGYKFVYLSARAIGQSKVTKDLLRKIRQDNLVLPEGPLMLSPISLISAFHREVIEKKPEEFKIKCMSDIGQLFPQNQRPFYAGFGNKINDVYAYKAVDIPFSRIFTINHRGELRHEKILTFQSSYQKLVDVVDHFFPPIQRRLYGNTLLHSELVIPNEFRSMSFWREPLPEITLDSILQVKGQEVKDTASEKK